MGQIDNLQKLYRCRKRCELRTMRLVTFVALLCGLAHVKGDISELDIFKDVQPLRIGAFNIQIFGETTFMKSEVRHELIKVNQ